MKTAQRPVQTGLDWSLERLCILRYSHMLGKDPHTWQGHIHMPGDGPHAWYGCHTIRRGMMHHLPWCNAQAIQSGHFTTPPRTPPHGMAPWLPHPCPLTQTRARQVWDMSLHRQDPPNHRELTPTVVHHPGAHGWL